MALSLVTAPIAEPVSLSEQKAHMRIDGDEDDAYIASCITAARTHIEGQTKHSIMDQTWDYGIDYAWPVKFGALRIDLPLNPIQAQTSPETFTITYVDSDGASQSLASTQFTVANRTHGSYVVAAYGVSLPDVRWVPDAITVRFVSGDSSNVPSDLHQAVMILASQFYEERETSGGISKAVEALISPYRMAVTR